MDELNNQSNEFTNTEPNAENTAPKPTVNGAAFGQGVPTQPSQPAGQPYQPQYPPVNPYYNPMQPPTQNLEEPVSIGQWVGTLLLLCIPCVNIILLLVWAFGDGKKSKSNFAKAYLIILGIGILLYIILLVFLAALGISIAEYYQDVYGGYNALINLL